MSSFQFPANPSDGDIVVRGNLQAFYNAATNTWRVSEVPTAPGIPGPPGPPGPEGPPGKGVEVSGVVDTFADLPAENAHQFEYWVVSDTNTLYISDGLQWVALGGPIQGPQGDPGEDGNDGSNGQNGRGWYDTNIIDERPNNYQIEFKSNDGLGFVTDNIMGPQGETGSLQVATATTLGGIKIGRGLDIDPTGTASAGVTTVSLETTPLAPGQFILPNIPRYIEFELQNQNGPGNTKTYESYGASAVDNWAQTQVETIAMPDTANAAIVTWTVPSIFSTDYASDNHTYPNGQVLNFRSYLNHKLEVNGAELIGRGSTSESYKPVAHNYNPVYYNKGGGVTTISDKFTTNSFNKIELITFSPGSQVTFKIISSITSMSTGTITVGGLRATIQPFKTESNIPRSLKVGNDPIDEQVYSLTQDDINMHNAADLRARTIELVRDIDSLLLIATDQADLDNLNQMKADALNLVNLPGAYEDLVPILNGLCENINTNYLSNQYRFE